jgi:hypothetical protein
MSGPYNPFFPWAPTIIAGAANIPTGTNPPFASDDFLTFYPQFADKVPDPVLAQFITMANATVLQARWNENWSFGMCLFVAHFVTLYMQTMTGGNATAAQVIEAAQLRGLITSEAAGDVNYSQDFSLLIEGLNGWAGWKSTQYGIQFAQLGKMMGKGGIGVW